MTGELLHNPSTGDFIMLGCPLLFMAVVFLRWLYSCESGALELEIKGASCLFDGHALNGVGIDHGCPYITMAQQFLNREDIVIGLK